MKQAREGSLKCQRGAPSCVLSYRHFEGRYITFFVVLDFLRVRYCNNMKRHINRDRNKCVGQLKYYYIIKY